MVLKKTNIFIFFPIAEKASIYAEIGRVGNLKASFQQVFFFFFKVLWNVHYMHIVRKHQLLKISNFLW